MNEADKPWLNGKPYYCDTCGLGGAEVMACEDGDCKMETAEEAQARQRKHIAQSKQSKGTSK